jgi:hypothetical protein
MLGVNKDVAIVASHNSMSIEINAEAAPMRVKIWGRPKFIRRVRDTFEPLHCSLLPTTTLITCRVVSNRECAVSVCKILQNFEMEDWSWFLLRGGYGFFTGSTSSSSTPNQQISPLFNDMFHAIISGVKHGIIFMFV